MAFANVPRAGQAQVVWHEWRELLSAVTPWSSLGFGEGRNRGKPGGNAAQLGKVILVVWICMDL